MSEKERQRDRLGGREGKKQRERGRESSRASEREGGRERESGKRYSVHRAPPCKTKNGVWTLTWVQ